MTLLDRCRELRTSLQKHGDLRRAHKDAEALRERTRELRERREGITAPLQTVAVLREKGVSVGKLPDVSSTLGLVEEYPRKLREGSLEAGKVYGFLKRSLTNMANQVTGSVDKALKVLERSLPIIDEAFLKQIEFVPGHAEHVKRIREERARLSSGKALCDMTAAQLREFLDRRDELRRLADELAPDDYPVEVREFFKAARQTDGAALDKFTSTVQAWLQERDLLTNVRIKVVDR